MKIRRFQAALAAAMIGLLLCGRVFVTGIGWEEGGDTQSPVLVNLACLALGLFAFVFSVLIATGVIRSLQGPGTGADLRAFESTPVWSEAWLEVPSEPARHEP